MAKLARQIERIKFLGLISCVHLGKRSHNLEKLSPHIQTDQSDLSIHHPACLTELL